MRGNYPNNIDQREPITHNTNDMAAAIKARKNAPPKNVVRQSFP